MSTLSQVDTDIETIRVAAYELIKIAAFKMGLLSAGESLLKEAGRLKNEGHAEEAAHFDRAHRLVLEQSNTITVPDVPKLDRIPVLILTGKPPEVV